MSSSGGGGGGRSKKKSKRAYFKRAASSKHSATFDPVHSTCQFLLITADQGKERQCGHEMAAWCSEILEEKFPHIKAPTTQLLTAEQQMQTESVNTSSAASSAAASPAASVSDELAEELRALQQSDHGSKRRRQEDEEEKEENEEGKEEEASGNEAHEAAAEEKSSSETKKKESKKKKSSSSSVPLEIIFPVSTNIVKVRGVVVLALNHSLLSANELFQQLFLDVLERGRISSRLAIRAFPLQAACFARMDLFEKLCEKIIPQSFQSFPSAGTFSIIVNRRGNNSQMNRDDLIKLIAALVPKSYSVNLSTPDVFIIVEVVERMAAIGCITNDNNIPNFNLRKAHEIYLQKQTPSASNNSGTNSSSSATMPSKKRQADGGNANQEQIKEEENDGKMNEEKVVEDGKEDQADKEPVDDTGDSNKRKKAKTE